MLGAMFIATMLYDLLKILFKYYRYVRIMRSLKYTEENSNKGKPIGYVEVTENGTLLEHIFDINYKTRGKN